jgi:hypothetical protein
MLMAFILAAAPATASAQSPRPLDPPAVVIARADTNRDGASSIEEWGAIGNHVAGFPLIDTDKDGKVTVEELTAFRARNSSATAPASGAALK